MANEITIKGSIALANGADKYAGNTTSWSVTQTTTRPANLLGVGSANTTTSAAALTLPAVTGGNQGWAQFYNLDADTTKYIEIGPVSDGGTIEKAFKVYGSGPPATMMLIPSVTYWAQASSGTQVLQVIVVAV